MSELAEKERLAQLAMLEAEAAKLRSEATKLDAEATRMALEWWKRPTYVGSVATLAVTLFGVGGVTVNAWFSDSFAKAHAQAAEIVEAAKEEVKGLKKDRDSSNFEILKLIELKEEYSRQIEAAESEHETLTQKNRALAAQNQDLAKNADALKFLSVELVKGAVGFQETLDSAVSLETVRDAWNAKFQPDIRKARGIYEKMKTMPSSTPDSP